MLEVGTRVRICMDSSIGGDLRLNGRTGFIAKLEPDGMHGVSIDNNEGFGHDCHHSVPDNSGRWIHSKYLEIIGQPSMLKDPLFTLEELTELQL
jgi:hypothetical protein